MPPLLKLAPLFALALWHLREAGAIWMGSDVYHGINAARGPNTPVQVSVIADERSFHVDRQFNATIDVVSGVSFSYLVASNGDLFAIKRNATGTRSTEVHVLSAASNFTQYVLQTGTVLEEAPEHDRWAFALAPNRDLYVFKKRGTGTRRTEIHVLSAVYNYGQYVFQTGTVLEETAGGDWAFALAGNTDVFAIKKSNTGTHSTEVHVLPRANFYQQFALETGTAVGETSGGDWAFALASNRDLYAIKKSATGTTSTEIHVLSAASNYLQFSFETGTDFAESPGSSYSFAVADAISIDPRVGELILYEGTYYGGRNYVYEIAVNRGYCVTVNNIATYNDKYGHKCPHDVVSSAKLGACLDHGEYDQGMTWFNFDKNNGGEEIALKPEIDPKSKVKRVPSFQPKKYCDNNQIVYKNCNDRLSSFRMCS